MSIRHSVALMSFYLFAYSVAHGFTDAEYKNHVQALKQKVPSGFTIVIQAPFIVIGDEAPAVVKQRSENTVAWAVSLLKKDYFARDPENIIDIWLFKDDQSYYGNAKLLFHDQPTTPFGYYSDANNALIMNIQTGGGTLVHEMVHPFMHTNFPECPSWFNEGLASLYEQSREKDGHIAGMTNWRLAGLQQAIKQKHLPLFQELTSMDSDAFYQKDRGTNYAQSRYLCYYLQENGLLVKYYHQFAKNRNSDPTGYVTLQQILHTNDMKSFQQTWEQFVLKLRFPN